MKNFPGPFRSPLMFKYKEKTAFTYNIQSVVHCRKFPFEPLEKCMTFKDNFPGLSRTLSFNFQYFPRPKWFSRTFQVLEFSRKKSRTFQEAWEPWPVVVTVIAASSDRSWWRPGCSWQCWVRWWHRERRSLPTWARSSCLRGTCTGWTRIRPPRSNAALSRTLDKRMIDRLTIFVKR